MEPLLLKIIMIDSWATVHWFDIEVYVPVLAQNNNA